MGNEQGFDGEFEELAVTQDALETERDEADAAVSEAEQERTVPWSKNVAWDSDVSFLSGLFEIGVLINNAIPVISTINQLKEYGELSEEVQKRSVDLTIAERVLIYTALQVLGIVSGTRWRPEMDTLLTLLETLVEPTELEEQALFAAEEVANRKIAEVLKEHFAAEHPGVGVYTPEEFEEELANRESEDPTIQRLQAEQDASLN